MNKTCVDCTVFDPNQGMEGHPVFTTEDGWAEHRWKSHGGPKPAVPSENPEKGTASRGFGGSGVVAEAVKPVNVKPSDRPNHDGKNLEDIIDAAEARFANLEEIQKIQADEIKSWAARVVDLEEQVRRLQNPTQ